MLPSTPTRRSRPAISGRVRGSRPPRHEKAAHQAAHGSARAKRIPRGWPAARMCHWIYSGGTVYHHVALTYNTGGAGSITVVADNAFRRGYAGYGFDPMLSLAGASFYHVRNWVYDAENGRWTNRDPLGYVDGMGLYQYVASTPVVAHDSTGNRRDWPLPEPLAPSDQLPRQVKPATPTWPLPPPTLGPWIFPSNPPNSTSASSSPPYSGTATSSVSSCSISLSYSNLAGCVGARVAAALLNPCKILRSMTTMSQGCPAGCACVDQVAANSVYTISRVVILTTSRCNITVTFNITTSMPGSIGRCECGSKPAQPSV